MSKTVDQPVDSEMAEFATKFFNELMPKRKTFGPSVKANLELIGCMTVIQKAEVKRKWMASARTGVNGVEEHEAYPAPIPAEQPPIETNDEEAQRLREITSDTPYGTSGEQSSNGKTNGFKFCAKENKRVPESICEDCPDQAACEERGYFIKECKIFDDTLGGIIFQAVLKEQAGTSDPKLVPPDKFQAVLIRLNEAVDQQNAQANIVDFTPKP
jgi:hypothetical protein